MNANSETTAKHHTPPATDNTTAKNQPARILVAGDWHCNVRWAEETIFQSRRLLIGENIFVILQLGDFGVFTGENGDHYLRRVQAELEYVDAKLLVVPGNHEDYDRLDGWATPNQLPYSPVVYGRTYDRIAFLPRGYRWEWHGRTWLACGGAASPDHTWRERHFEQTGIRSWWPQEDITDDDVRKCIDPGHADVLVSHDRPALARINLPPWPRGWADADHARCEVSREKVQTICQWATPRWVMHGHYHNPFSSEEHDLGYGPVTVSQLNMDGRDGNYRVLDIRDMTWQ